MYTFSQVGSDVQMTAAGSIKTGSLTSFQTLPVTSGSQKAAWTTSSPSTEIFFGTTGDSFTRYNLPNGGFATDGGSIGNGTNVTKFFNTVSAGSTVTGFTGGGFDSIYLPDVYVSESAINATGTFTGTTIAGMGLIPGTYNWTWGGAEPDFVSVTVVPEPSTYAMALVVLACGGYSMRRRRLR